MLPFNLSVLAPDHPYYNGPCESLVITTTEGEYGVLANHSNTIMAVVPGSLKITIPGGETMNAAVSYGLIKIENNDVLILVNTIENPDEIDEAHARRDLEKAQEEMLNKQSQKDYLLAQAKINRAMNRLRVKKHSR